MAKKKVNKNKSIILLIGIIIVLIYFGYNIINLVIEPTETFLIKKDILFEEESTVGYIIREETVVENTNGGQGVIPIKVEGEKVAKGDIIYRYDNPNQEILNNQIKELNNEIQKALEGQTEIFSSDIKVLNNQIEAKIDNLQYENDIQKIIEYKKDIDTYIEKKVKIIGDSSKSGSYIKDLITERANIEKQLETETKYEIACQSGVVSYRIDNLENALTPKDFEELDKETLEGLNLKTGQIVSSNNEQCKIVNNYECYIATNVDSNNAKQAKVGDKIKIRLSTRRRNYCRNCLYI